MDGGDNRKPAAVGAGDNGDSPKVKAGRGKKTAGGGRLLIALFLFSFDGFDHAIVEMPAQLDRSVFAVAQTLV